MNNFKFLILQLFLFYTFATVLRKIPMLLTSLFNRNNIVAIVKSMTRLICHQPTPEQIYS